MIISRSDKHIEGLEGDRIDDDDIPNDNSLYKCVSLPHVTLIRDFGRLYLINRHLNSIGGYDPICFSRKAERGTTLVFTQSQI